MSVNANVEGAFVDGNLVVRRADTKAALLTISPTAITYNVPLVDAIPTTTTTTAGA